MKKITFILLLFMASFSYAQPGTGAPTPPVRNAIDVIAVYSDAYTQVSGLDIDPSWGQATDATEVVISSNNTLKYASLNYQGTQYSSQDVSGMEYIHLDYYTDDATALKFSVISPGAENAYDFLTDGSGITTGSWVSVDIPLTHYTVPNLAAVFQFKTEGNGTVYLDNLYYWKAPAAAGTDATLSDLQVDAATISGFASNSENYTYGLVEGTVTVPQITTATTTDGDATRVITQAGAIPGDATVVVTAQDGTTQKTYTVSFKITSPADAAPTPPNRNASDVISIYSDSYTNISGINYNPGWGQSGTVADVDIDSDGNNAMLYDNFNYQGTDFSGNAQDASAMEYLHVDMWTNDATVVKVSPINSAPGTGAGELLVSMTPVTGGSWVGYDLPIGDFTGMVWDNIIQLKFDAQAGTSPTKIYLDNIYFYKGMALSVDKHNINNIVISPNPASDNLNIDVDNFESVILCNISGQKVLEASTSSIDISSLASGVYIAKVLANGTTSTIKVIKK
jgi:hypothetical protein